MNHRYALGIIFMFLIFAAGCGAADPEQISMEETTGFHTLDPEQIAEILEESLDEDGVDSELQAPTPADLTEVTATATEKPTLVQVPSGSLNEATVTATIPEASDNDSPNYESNSHTELGFNNVATTVGFKIPDSRENKGVFSASADSNHDIREEAQVVPVQIDDYATTFDAGTNQGGPTLVVTEYAAAYDDCEPTDRDCSDD